VLSEILQLAFWMRKTGYRNSTTQTCVRALKGLARKTNLLDPESVKSYLAERSLIWTQQVLHDWHCACRSPYRFLRLMDITESMMKVNARAAKVAGAAANSGTAAATAPPSRKLVFSISGMDMF
jgi:hypothetical protein